jgi:hypothetical protein
MDVLPDKQPIEPPTSSLKSTKLYGFFLADSYIRFLTNVHDIPAVSPILRRSFSSILFLHYEHLSLGAQQIPTAVHSSATDREMAELDPRPLPRGGHYHL